MRSGVWVGGPQASSVGKWKQEKGKKKTGGMKIETRTQWDALFSSQSQMRVSVDLKLNESQAKPSQGLRCVARFFGP